MCEAEPERRPAMPVVTGADVAAVQEQRLRSRIRHAAAAARRAEASRQFGRPFDEAVARVCEHLDASFWTHDEWGSAFDRRHFAHTVVGLVGLVGLVDGRRRAGHDPRLVQAVLDCLEYTLVNPLAPRPGVADWAATRSATFHEDAVAADAVAAIFAVSASASSSPS
jgi:hypothetical protein